MRRSHEQVLFKVTAAAVLSEREALVPPLPAMIEGGEISQSKWLGMVPSSRAIKSLEEQIERVAFLKALDADRLILPDLPLARLEHGGSALSLSTAKQRGGTIMTASA